MAAPRTIEIKGHTYNRCCVSKEQWKNCTTPCMFCDERVQEHCKWQGIYFCYHAENEKVCYIDLGAIYGETNKQ